MPLRVIPGIFFLETEAPPLFPVLSPETKVFLFGAMTALFPIKKPEFQS
jgi:hypothetical protein